METAHARLQPAAAAGCGLPTRMRRKDAVPDASQPQPGRGGGGAEPQTEAAVAGETQAGGREPGTCHLPAPPPTRCAGVPQPHPHSLPDAHTTSLQAADTRAGRTRGHLDLRISKLSGRTSVTLGLSLVPCLGNRVEAPLGLAPTHPEEGLLLELQCLKHLGCQFSLGKPVILSHHSAWHR